MEEKYLVDICNPKQWKTIPKSELIEDGEFPVYGANGIIGRYNKYNHEKPTVLITCRGATCGNIHITVPKSYINGNAMSLDDLNESKCKKEYLYYFLKYYDHSKIISGTAQPQITINGLKKVKVKLYSIEKQEKIVEELNKINKLIDLKKRQLEELSGFIKSQFVEMFGETSEAYKKHRIIKLSEIAEYYNGLTYKPVDVSEMGTIVLRSGNIQNSKLEYSDIVRVKSNIKEKQYVKENDILMCSRNGSEKLVGKVAMIKEQEEKMTFGAFMLIIRSKYYTYLFSYFQSDDFRKKIKYGATTTINQITVNMLNKLELPMPDIKLQNQFSEIVKQIDKQKFESMIQLKMMEKIYNIINDRRRYV